MSNTHTFTQYERLAAHVFNTGTQKTDRTGTGTQSVFGYQMRFDLSLGFPLVTTKKVHVKSIIAELLWFLSGSTNNNDLRALGSTIWDEWADPETGELGPIYGKQFRAWSTGRLELVTDKDGHVRHNEKTIDQIAQVIETLRTDPDSRRIIVSAWNVADLDAMALSPCHALFQFYTSEINTYDRRVWADANGITYDQAVTMKDLIALLDAAGVPTRRLSCQLYQRSADVFLGVPFNIASYALLIHMVAQQVNMVPGELIWTGGDCHIYSNHFEQISEQLSRGPLPAPRLVLKKADDIFSYQLSDFELVGYHHHPAIKGSVAV